MHGTVMLPKSMNNDYRPDMTQKHKTGEVASRETWFVDSVQRLTGETSPRDEEAVVFRDLTEHPDEVRASMRWTGGASRLGTAEQSSVIAWMDYIARLRQDMYHRTIDNAPGRERITFSEAGLPNRLIPTFAHGSWASETRYTLNITGDPRYDLELTITPPDGIRVTDLNSGQSNMEDSNLVLTFDATQDLMDLTLAVSPHIFTPLRLNVDFFVGSDIEQRFQNGELFQVVIGHEPVQGMITGRGAAVSVLIN